MKFTLSLLAFAAVAELAFAQNDTPTTTVVEQDKFWAITDMLVGTMFGAYGPISLYARKRDCFSRFWQLGLQFVEYSKLADGTDISTFNYVQLGINAL